MSKKTSLLIAIPALLLAATFAPFLIAEKAPKTNAYFDPLAEGPTERQRYLVPNNGCKLGGDQRCHCRRCREPEERLICYGQRHIGIEVRECAGGGGDPPVPIRQRSGSIDGQRERRAIRAREQTVEQNAGRFARFEL